MNPLVAGLDDRGMPRLLPELVADYTAAGWWGTQSLADLVGDWADRRPDSIAIRAAEVEVTWSGYDSLADAVAQALLSAGVGRGDCAAVLIPDGVAVHAALIGCQRAGVLAMGIGARCGDAEIEHLIRTSGARAIITLPDYRGRSAAHLQAALGERGAALDVVVTMTDLGIQDVTGRLGAVRDADPLGPNDISMLNSTSGTTGLPKCVTQFDNRWIHFCRLAIEGGHLDDTDRALSVVPAPYGFGLWTSHYLGPVLGITTTVLPTFTADEMIRVIERERITVLNAVTTQFRMMLTSSLLAQADLSSLRVMYTGGEAIPYERAVEFEERTGATLLQFFGSNETGAVSRTTMDDPRHQRLTTGGRLIPHMHGRVVDAAGRALPAGERGAPACRGPLTSAGYFRDERAEGQLFTDDGWMLMGDVVTLDEDGYLTLVGRTSDIIIRGGKNISAAEVEDAVETHPDVTLVSVVPVPDEVFGERVCAVVTVRPGAIVDVDSLAAHLKSLGISREWWPERLIVVDEMPRNAGGKIAKSVVRDLAVERLVPKA